GGPDLRVVNLDVDAGFDQLDDDLGAEVLELVGRRDGEIAFLVSGAVGVVRLGILAGVPDAFHRIDLVNARELVLVEAHAVEDVKLALRAKVARVSEAGGEQEGFSLLYDVALYAGGAQSG